MPTRQRAPGGSGPQPIQPGPDLQATQAGAQTVSGIQIQP